MQELTEIDKPSIIHKHIPLIMDYKPYSPEWTRKRYLKEALDKYFNDYVDTSVIYEDILDILSERSERAYQEFSKVNELEYKLNGTRTH